MNQDITIPREATRIHGITTERMKAEGIAPKESLARLFEMMNQAATCVGYNIHRFDIPFMLADARRLGLTPPPTDNFVDTAALFEGWKLGVAKRPGETHRRYAENVLSRKASGVRFSIPVCLNELGIDVEHADLHDAGGDAYATHLIVARLAHVASFGV